MGATKTNLFTAQQNDLADIAKALAHPARIAIIEQVLASDTCINGSLVDKLGLAQATISQHLKALKEAGVIIGSTEGKKICYCLDTQKWEEIQNKMVAFLDKITAIDANNCC